jgi:hypothetical protein
MPESTTACYSNPFEVKLHEDYPILGLDVFFNLFKAQMGFYGCCRRHRRIHRLQQLFQELHR